MNTQKYIITIIVCLFFSVTFAQDVNTAQGAAQYQDELMKKELNLTEAQIIPVAEINLKYAKKQRALMDADGSMFSKFGDMKKIGKKKSEALKSILTDSQFERYEDEVEPAIKKYMRKNIKM